MLVNSRISRAVVSRLACLGVKFDKMLALALLKSEVNCAVVSRHVLQKLTKLLFILSFGCVTMVER